MAQRKTAMGTEPKKRPPTGGGLKAPPNTPTRRLSPGVYRSAGGGLVGQRGRPLPQGPTGQRMADSLNQQYQPAPQPQQPQQLQQPLPSGMAPLPPNFNPQALADGMQQDAFRPQAPLPMGPNFNPNMIMQNKQIMPPQGDMLGFRAESPQQSQQPYYQKAIMPPQDQAVRQNMMMPRYGQQYTPDQMQARFQAMTAARRGQGGY